jgi:hypothetical protein
MATRYNYTGGIVTNGLVLNLDAAKTDSYPGTGTTWRDLSGFNNNGTLTNGPTFSGIGKQASIVFDGVNDFVDLGNSSNVTTFTSLTINTWVKPVTLPLSFNQGRVIIRGDDSYRLYWYDNGGGTGNKLYFFSSHIGEASIASSVGYLTSNFTTNVWYNITALYNGSQTQLFVNGSLVATSTGKSGTITGTNNILLGKSNGNEYYLNGSMASIQLYNRALTAQEITQNFNTLRGRYGI